MSLVERDRALQVLSALFDEAASGRGRVALVRGEAGIGKTALIGHFVASLDDAHVLWGGCDDLLTAQPLSPVWDMVFDEPGLEESLRDDDRQTTFRSVLDLLSRSLRPTVMVMEDVHWADEATLDLIKFVGRRINRTHGLLVLSYRDVEVKGDHPLKVAMGDLPYGVVERIHLEPLSSEGVSEIAGGDADADDLWKLTGGNPFFVSEVLAAGNGSVPQSIRDAVVARVQRLSEPAREVVELASVSPGRIEVTIVNDVLGDPAGAIAECEEAGVLELKGDALSFRHELARRAVEGDLAEIERRRLNLACLEAAERLGFDLARLAHHARKAEDPAAIVRILPESARRAADVESHSEALANLRALEPFLDAMTVAQLADHYDLWAYEEYLARDAGSEIIEKAIELRRELGDPAALGNSLLLASRIAWVRSKRDEALAYVEEALHVLGPVGGDELALAYSTVSQLAMLGNEEGRALEFGKKALDLVGDRKTQARAHALNNIGAVIMHNHYPEGVSELEESYRISRELGASHDTGRAAVNLAWGYIQVKELELARRWVEEALEITSGAEMPSFESYAYTEKAMWHELRGEWDIAETLCRDLLDGSALLSTSRATTMMVLARVQTRRGETDASSLVTKAMAIAEEADEIQRLGPAAAVAAEHHWLGGDLPDRLLGRAVEIRDLCASLGGHWLAGEVSQWLHLGGVVTDHPKELPEPYKHLVEGAWRQAAAWWASKNVDYERAVALSLGDVDAQLEALDVLDRLGAVPLASRVRTALHAAGVKGVPRGPQRATRDNPLGLTARQSDVLELLRDGLTNAEIADRLFISTRTVDHHVSAILAKLGAANRSEAVDKAREMV